MPLYAVIFLHHNFRVKVLLLKAYKIHDLIPVECHIFRTDYPFILYIVQPMNDRDDLACKLLKGFIYPYYVSILLLTVRCNNTGNITVVDRIVYIFVLWVIASERSVNRDRNNFSDHTPTQPQPSMSTQVKSFEHGIALAPCVDNEISVIAAFDIE